MLQKTTSILDKESAFSTIPQNSTPLPSSPHPARLLIQKKQWSKPLPVPDRPACITFTGGGTSLPKRVVMLYGTVSPRYLPREMMEVHRRSFSSTMYDFAAYSFAVALINFPLALTSRRHISVAGTQERQIDLSDGIISLRANTAMLTLSVLASCHPRVCCL